MLTMACLIGICLIVSIITYFVSIPSILIKHTDGKGWEASVVSSIMTYLQSLYLPFFDSGAKPNACSITKCWPRQSART